MTDDLAATQSVDGCCPRCGNDYLVWCQCRDIEARCDVPHVYCGACELVLEVLTEAVYETMCERDAE